tara:strand:+ start:29826 stop:36614 length:6789 start_codon:yes stop_codon:yes gene_type:complete
MNKYKTPSGDVLTEEELRSRYGDQFDSLVADGVLTLVEGEEAEKKNPVVTSGSDSEQENTVSTTNLNNTPGFSDSSDPIEINEDVNFDISLPKNQQTLVENKSNLDILNSIGFFDDNKPEMVVLDEKNQTKEKSYQIKDPITGEFNLKKESEIPEPVLKAIKLHEKANPKVVDTEEVIITEEDYTNPDKVDSKILSQNNIDEEDYLKWEKKNIRPEGSVYKFLKTLLPSDEGNQYEMEKRQYEKLQSYNASKLNNITSALSANEAAQKLTTNPNDIRRLRLEAVNLKKEFMETYSTMESAINLFPVYKEEEIDSDLRKRKELYQAVKSGGLREFTGGGLELLKTGATALTSFAGNFIGGIPGAVDQRLTKFGYNKKGLLAGLSDMFVDSSEAIETEIGETQRPAFLEGKPVTYNSQEFIVDANGTVYDAKSNIRMDGILPDSEIKTIINRSKDVPNSTINWTGGSVLTGGVNTLMNLFALIRTGGKVNKSTGLEKIFKPGTAGKVGMGVASFTSGVVSNVEDIRSQLVATGMGENEAMEIAVDAGQAIATLDGIFSGIAGSNEQLLIGFQGIKDQVKNLAIKEGKKFTKKQLVDKGIALGKENFKELFVEELPVYFTEKAINNLVNQKVGNTVLDQKITAAGVLETAVMTIGATSTLGSKNLLTGNKRKDLVRTLASDVQDLQKTLNVLVTEGSLNKEQAANAYTEIYNMKAAELKTKGTVKMSKNVEEASDLLTQRQNLIEQREGLEGPLKEELDKRIEDVDAQIKKLQQRDITEAQSIIDKQKDSKDKVEVTREEAVQAFKAENEFRVKAGLPVLIESEQNITKKQNELIKDKQDAIQKSSTEKVDVQEQSTDGQTVGERDTEGAVTQQGKKETEDVLVESKEAEVTPVREKIDQPFQVPNSRIDVTLNQDGTAKVYKRGTNQTVKYVPQKASKYILTDVIDVNEGNLATIPEGTPEGDVFIEIADTSNNVYEVVQAIKQVEDSMVDAEMETAEGGIFNILQLKFTPESWKRITGVSPKESGVSNFWISKKDGVSIEDGWVDVAPELSIDMVIDFIESNPTLADVKNLQKGGLSQDLVALKQRFKELTGLSATKFNLNTVLSIDPNREPLRVTETRNVEQLTRESLDPNVDDFGKKKGPSAEKITGKKIKKVKVDEQSALKDQIRLEAKAARDAKKDQTKRRRGLVKSIKGLLKEGNITNKKALSLIKKVSNVNLNNAKKVQDVIDFIEKSLNDSSYSAKLSKANALIKSIKKNLKGKEAAMSDSAKQFVLIDPNTVENIDTYLNFAENIKNGLMKTKRTGKGVKISKPFDVKKVDAYSKKQIDLQNKRNYELAKESFELLTGLEAGELTLDEMKEALYDIEGEANDPGKKSELLAKNKEAVIDKAIKNAFQNTKINIKGSIEAGDVELNKEKKELIRDFLNMDLKLLSTAQKMAALDSIINFEINESTGGMESILRQYVGNKNMIKMNNENIKSSLKSTWLGRMWNKHLSTLPNVFELMFASQEKARKITKALGLDGVIDGYAKAEKEANDVEQDYANVFAKKKMKNGIYFDEMNDLERGVLAEVRRFTPGTEVEQQNEFDVSKKLIDQTIKRLEASKDSNDKAKAEKLRAVYDNILKDSNNISEVESKVDPVNLEGVEYVTQIWANKYQDLADTSLNVYNRNLGKDINYTPRSVQTLTQEDKTPDITEPVFNPENLSKSPYDKETGVLKVATKPPTLPEGKVLNLGFDRQNLSNYKAALTDIYTAPSIQQIKGAQQSEYFKEVFPNENARDIVNLRIKNYVDSKRGKRFFNAKDKIALDAMNKLATMGVVKALGGVTQPFKQIVPIFNTSINAGPINTIKGVELYLFNPDARKAIDNSGLAIANRGIKAQSDLESVDSRIDNTTRTKGGKLLKAYDNLNKTILQKTLVDPDVGTAKASFLAYYIQAMDKKGVSLNEIDWTQPLEKDESRFAQQQVDRQQNTSDQDLQGDLFTSQALTKQTIRKVLFPFANFLLNQKTRMYSDINTLFRNPTALPGDKTAALKSLAGLGVENATFNAIGLGISAMLANTVSSLIGMDEEEEGTFSEKIEKIREAERKRLQNQIIGRGGNLIADIVSPLPFLNDEVLSVTNSLVGLFQDGGKDDFKFFVNTNRGLSEQLGVLGIGGEKLQRLTEMIRIAQTGEVTTEYGGKKSTKKLTKDAQNKIQNVAVVYALFIAGGIPFSEVGYMSEKALRDLKKRKQPGPKKFKEEKKTSLSLKGKGKLESGALNKKNNKLQKGRL